MVDFYQLISAGWLALLIESGNVFIYSSNGTLSLSREVDAAAESERPSSLFPISRHAEHKNTPEQCVPKYIGLGAENKTLPAGPFSAC
jgi:hypothetical protein